MVRTRAINDEIVIIESAQFFLEPVHVFQEISVRRISICRANAGRDVLTHSKQYTRPPFGPIPTSFMTSSSVTSSLMSMAGSYSKASPVAAGSRLTMWAVRLDTRRWVAKEVQNVDFPAPAGPVTKTA